MTAVQLEFVLEISCSWCWQ